MPRFRLAPVAVAVVAILAACASESTSSPQASAYVVTSKTTLNVGDTMLVKAGLRYTDGRFVEFTSYTVAVVDTSIARVLVGTKIVQAKTTGDAVVRVRIPSDPVFQLDTSYRVNPAP